VIAKSLTAKVILYPTEEAKKLLDEAGSLKQLFIVSQVEIAGDKQDAPNEALSFEHVSVIVEPADGETCERCWVVSADVGKHKDHPTLCTRCVEVLSSAE